MALVEALAVNISERDSCGSCLFSMVNKTLKLKIDAGFHWFTGAAMLISLKALLMQKICSCAIKFVEDLLVMLWFHICMLSYCGRLSNCMLSCCWAKVRLLCDPAE